MPAVGSDRALKAPLRPPFDIAIIYTGLDDQGHALEWLEKAFDDMSLEMIFLKVDPRFDRLHANPRFTALLRRMGLPS